MIVEVERQTRPKILDENTLYRKCFCVNYEPNIVFHPRLPDTMGTTRNLMTITAYLTQT